MRRYAAAARVSVEIGVAEGGSAWEIAQSMPSDVTLYLIDPYHLRSLHRFSPARSVAHRLVGSVARGGIVWVEQFSHDAVADWELPIDFLFIDGLHTHEAVRRDWDEWTRHVAPAGHVALHDSRTECGWTTADDGPVRLLAEIRRDPAWSVVEGVDSTSVLVRVA